MKRNIYILVILMSMFSFTALSQSLTLLKESNTLHNDTMLVVSFDTVTYMNSYYDIVVKNNTASKIDVMVKKVYLSILPGVDNGMCWGGMCSNEFILGPEEIPANGTGTDFSYDYNPRGKTGVSIIRYVFYKQTAPSDSVCFRVKFRHPVDVGINEIYKNYVFTNAFPNPANNVATFNYSYSSDVNFASIVVTDLLGKEVRNIQLTNCKGKVSLNTADISNGIYLYSLQLNDRTVSTRKLIVNH